MEEWRSENISVRLICRKLLLSLGLCALRARRPYGGFIGAWNKQDKRYQQFTKGSRFSFFCDSLNGLGARFFYFYFVCKVCDPARTTDRQPMIQ